jgi:hypothetical protein
MTLKDVVTLLVAWWGAMTPKDWITLLLAVWGAFWSTLLAVRTLRDDRPHVLVTCEFAGMYLQGSAAWQGFCIKAVNSGKRPIRIEEAGVLFSDQTKLVIVPYPPLGGDKLPKSIGTGDVVSVLVSDSALMNGIAEKGKGKGARPTHSYVRDAEGRLYRGDLAEDLRPPRRGCRLRLPGKRSAWGPVAGKQACPQVRKPVQ